VKSELTAPLKLRYGNVCLRKESPNDGARYHFTNCRLFVLSLALHLTSSSRMCADNMQLGEHSSRNQIFDH
jgi:hypothetical protein